MKQYIAKFPMEYGDMGTRIYKSKSSAIREAKKHFRMVADNLCFKAYCCVWEYDSQTKSKSLIYEQEI